METPSPSTLSAVPTSWAMAVQRTFVQRFDGMRKLLRTEAQPQGES